MGRGLWYRAWQWRAARRTAANREVVGQVERPLPGQRFQHALDVGGWARGRNGERASVRVEVGNTVVAEQDARLSRLHGQSGVLSPEIRRTREIETGDGDAFRLLLRSSQLPAGHLLWLTVKASLSRSASSNGWETLHSFPVRRGKGWLTPPPRDAYGRVWDQSSTNLRHARLSVAGYDDDGEWRRTGEASAEYMVRACAIDRGATVLEIGCGAARVGVHLAPRCARWIGADVSRNMIGHAREALRAAAVTNADFVHLNGYDLEGVADASIDAVYCTAVFMHLEEWDRYRYVREAFRVLRPGGRVYFDNFNLLTAEGWALFDETARLDVAIRPPNVSKSSTPQELQCYAERAGFEEIELDTGGLWVGVRARKPAQDNRAKPAQ